MKNFYIAMFDKRSNIRGDGTWYRLVGPFESGEAAEPYLRQTRTLSHSLDWRTEFCSFGIVAFESEKVGVLNNQILPTELFRKMEITLDSRPSSLYNPPVAPNLS